MLMAPAISAGLPGTTRPCPVCEGVQVFGSGEPVTPAVMKDLFATGLMATRHSRHG